MMQWRAESMLINAIGDFFIMPPQVWGRRLKPISPLVAQCTARADFPGGSAATLYGSIKRLYSLPPETRVFLCYDYPVSGSAPVSSTPLSQQRHHNVMLNEPKRMVLCRSVQSGIGRWLRLLL
ncbi:MAG: hypothetical protein LPH21_19245 [Shewanella sp.]|nr:hypothetical protein [Shewanella sp.]